MTEVVAGGQKRAESARPRLRDVGLAVALCILDLTLFSSVSRSAPPWTFVVAVAGFVPLLWRKLAPIPVFFAVLFIALGAALGSADLRPTLALLVASYSVAAVADRRTALVLSGLAVPTFLGISMQRELSQRSSAYSIGTLLVLGLLATTLAVTPWALGRLAHAHRQTLRDVQLAGEEAAERARISERRDIALELHDIISHSVAVMVLQADGARAVLHADPKAVEPALDHIAHVGRSSMGELRRLLGVLADGTAASKSRGANGIAQLPDVVDEAKRDGLNVRLDTTGRPSPVPASFEASVHRIVKETLANSLKHGGPGTEVSVSLFWSDEVLILTTSDKGAGHPSDPTLSTGHGLAGLRERIRALNGRFEAGPAADGSGFIVTATLPVPTVLPNGPNQLRRVEA